MPTHLQYSPEIYQPLEDNSVSAEGRARSFANLNPRSSYNDICGRKIVPSGRSARIVGGGVANYAEWPWTVFLVFTLSRFYCQFSGFTAAIQERPVQTQVWSCASYQPLDHHGCSLRQSIFSKSSKKYQILFKNIHRTFAQATFL